MYLDDTDWLDSEALSLADDLDAPVNNPVAIADNVWSSFIVSSLF